MTQPDRIRFGENVLETNKTRESTAYQRKMRLAEKEAEVASTWSNESYGVEERDYKHKQIFKGWTLLWLAYQSTGVIYGDIGTSPLYVFSSTFTSDPSYEDLLGALSLIIWSLTLIVTVKYILIVLCANDEGEGGTFAIYTLLARFSEITKRDPRSYRIVKIERYLNNQLSPSNRAVRGWLERSRIAHALLKILAVFGVSLIMADGVLMPAQSVLGAIQGIKIVRPDLGTSTIVGVSCMILVLLFLMQPLGIVRLSNAFAPIIIIWLLFNLVFGIYNLAVHDYTVLKAFSPYFAGDYFVRNGTDGWKSLGGILLCFTGVEALFADLGAFSQRAIQISWLTFTYPCLLLAYIGQAAYISEDPSAYTNPFFNTVPPHMFWPSLIISILAAIVASQALITSIFQLLSQIMHSSYFPHVQIIYTSTKFHGQVYIPLANWLMMIGTVIVTAVYNNTTKLGNAYGFCVVLVTFITTNLVTLVALIVWRIHPILVFIVWLPFVLLDSLYLSSAVTKVPDGAWFTLLLGALLASFFSLWRYGKEKQWASEAKQSVKLSDLIVSYSRHAAIESTASLNPLAPAPRPKNADTDAPKLCLQLPRYSGAELTPINGLGIFFDKAGTDTHVPQVYEQFIQKFEAQLSVVVFLHLRALGTPHVHEEERYSIVKTGVKDVYRLTIRHGYNDRVVTPDLGTLIYEELRKAIVRGTVGARLRCAPDLPSRTEVSIGEAGVRTVTTFEAPMAAAEEGEMPRSPTSAGSARSAAIMLQALDDAYECQTLYLVGKEQLRIIKKKGLGGLVRRGLLGLFLWVRDNTRQKVAQLDVPVEKLVEVGFVGMI